MSELWIPGLAGPLDQFVERLHRQIGRFASDAGVEQAFVQVELVDGARFTVHSLSAEPGFGFVTIRPHVEDLPDVPGEVVVPIGSVRRIEIDKAEEQRAPLGFSLPQP